MNAAPVASQGWSARKWWGVVLGLFGLQILFLWWFGARDGAAPRPAAPAPQLKLTTAAAREQLALVDPTLFAQGHPRGFSGAAWMTIPVPEYQPPEWSEPARWLALDARQLGDPFRRFVQTNRPFSFASVRKPEPALVVPEPPGTVVRAPSASLLRVEGDLASRRLLTSPSLPGRESPELLTNSVVQILVDAEGNVISHVLLGSSGRPGADSNALALARLVRFEPLPSSANPPLTWGTLVFPWQTLPVSPTNPPPAGP